MTPFLVGFVLGGAFVACGFIIFLTRKAPAELLDPWTEEYHRQPQATTTVLINRREIKL